MARLFKLEKRVLRLGYVPLTDSAPLLVAYEMGLFERWGLTVSLHPYSEWLDLHQAVCNGTIDAAHMLAPMPVSSTLGLNGDAVPMITPMVLSLNGNAITLSESLYQHCLADGTSHSPVFPVSSAVLKTVVAERAAQGKRLRFATVYPYSCHYYQLMSWLEVSGITPQQVDVIYMSPEAMTPALQAQDIDGFCVGGPWNAKAVRLGAGMTAVTSCDIWPDSPEKVLGMLASWQARHPETTLALVAALQEACNWLATVPNRFEAARLLAQPNYLNTALDEIAPSLLGSCLTHQQLPPRYVPSYNQFSAVDKTPGNSPDRGYGEWLLSQMQKWGHLRAEESAVSVDQIYRADIYQVVKDILSVQRNGICA